MSSTPGSLCEKGGPPHAMHAGPCFVESVPPHPYNSHTQELGSIEPEYRRAAQLEKSDRLFRLACHVQDELENIGIFHGDGKLLDAKVRIHDACEKARATCGKVRYGGSR